MASNTTYIPALDGLRTLAVFMVVINHFSHSLLPGGSIGVDVFFVLSGFLITGVLLRENNLRGRINLQAFYIRRFLRLMPALVIMVVCALGYSVVFGAASPNNWGSAAFALTYLMDFVRAYSSYSETSTVGHTWSLAVEEHFYLLWPLLLGAIVTLSHRKQPIAILGLTVGFVAWRVWLVYRGASFDRVYYGLDMRFDQLLTGCALAFCLAYTPFRDKIVQLTRLWPAALIGLISICIFGQANTNITIAAEFAPVLISGFSSILILELVHHPDGFPARVASTRPMVALGKISYGIYLWHYPVLLNARYYTTNKLVTGAAVLISIIIAALSYRYVEQPFLRLKNRFEPSLKPE